MKPVRSGDRGPAVEDIQRRLLVLGHELGPTGVDGVFYGRTFDAVRAFQLQHGLSEDGLVGDETWSALVDATFTLGDRMLYLRVPFFHGHDVAVLQQALNALGFACGAPDAIFGAFTERAVREFQRNAGLPADGIVGPETVRVIRSLRHVWEGKEPRSHSAAHGSPARAAEVLSRVSIALAGLDASGEAVANRMANLAQATTADARVTVVAADQVSECAADIALLVCGVGMASAVAGRPVVRLQDAETVSARMLTAVAAYRGDCPQVVVEVGGSGTTDERNDQRAAVILLDAVCFAFG